MAGCRSVSCCIICLRDELSTLSMFPQTFLLLCGLLGPPMFKTFHKLFSFGFEKSEFHFENRLSLSAVLHSSDCQRLFRGYFPCFWQRTGHCDNYLNVLCWFCFWARRKPQRERVRDREGKSAFMLLRSERLYLVYSVVCLVGLIPMTEPWLNGIFWWDLGAYPSFHIAISCGRKLRHLGKGRIAVCSNRRNRFIFLGRVWRLQGSVFSTQHRNFHTRCMLCMPTSCFSRWAAWAVSSQFML